MIKKMLRFIVGQYKPEDEIHDIKNEMFGASLKTQSTTRKANKLLYHKDATYFLAKGMNIIK